MGSSTLLKIYVSINLRKHSSGKLDSLIWLFFRNICTSLWTEPAIQCCYRTVFSKTYQILKTLFCRKTTLTCWKDRVIVMQTSLCFPPRETQAFFFTLYIQWKIFSFVAESVRSCKPSNFNCIHPGLPYRTSVSEQFRNKVLRTGSDVRKMELVSWGFQVSKRLQSCSVGKQATTGEHLCGLRLSVKEFWKR